MSNGHAAPGPTKRRKDLVYALTVLAAVLVLGWVVVTMQHLANNLAASNAARDALARQVQDLGAKPIAGPPGSRGEPGPAVTGAPGDPGSPGVAGSPGVKGDKGDPGVAGSPIPGPSGSPGRPGADSKVPGPQGVRGADSTVPGPKGDPGDPGIPGVPGQDGKDGADGTDGRDGAAGSPPAGWTYTDLLGQSYTCTPVDGFDPSSPRYTCTADAAPAPAGSPSRSGLLGVGLLAGTSTYRRL